MCRGLAYIYIHESKVVSNKSVSRASETFPQRGSRVRYRRDRLYAVSIVIYFRLFRLTGWLYRWVCLCVLLSIGDLLLPRYVYARRNRSS